MSETRNRQQGDVAGEQARSIHEVFARVLARTDQPTVSVGRILDAFGARAYGPLLFLIGVVIVSPLSAIPGAMIVAAVIVVAIMGQALVREGAPWIPGRIRRIRLGAARLRWALEKVMPWFEVIERMVRPRLVVLIRPPLLHLWSVCCMLIGLTLVPLTVIPFAVTVPGLSLAIIGLGLMTADGLLVLAGVAVSGGAFWLAYAALTAAVPG